MIRFVPYVLALYTNYHHAIMVVSGLPLVINVSCQLVPALNLETVVSCTRLLYFSHAGPLERNFFSFETHHHRYPQAVRGLGIL